MCNVFEIKNINDFVTFLRECIDRQKRNATIFLTSIEFRSYDFYVDFLLDKLSVCYLLIYESHTAKRILERLGIHTSSSFVKI